MKYAWKYKRKKPDKKPHYFQDTKRKHSECERKKGFTTTADANKQIQYVQKKEGISLRYYQCSYCGKYHLTKKWVKNKFRG